MTEPVSALVSVVVPCYNAAPYVGETIESVLSQTYPAVELIVVDDRSTDGSWEVVQRYSERLTAIRLPENRGGSHARNRGAERARGEFLMFLDADDLIAPDTLQALVAALSERPDGIAACPWKRLVLQEGEWKKVPGEVPLPAAEEDHLAGWLEDRWVPPCAILWRRKVYERTGGWDEELRGNDDGDLMMRAFARGARLVPTTRGEAHYRRHPAETMSVSSSSYTEAKFRSWVRVLEKLESDLKERGLLERYREPLGFAYHDLALRGFRHGHTDLARECAQRGSLYGGRKAVSRTLPGRLLSWLLGVERKERIVSSLAQFGVATRERRRATRLHQLHHRAEGEGKPGSTPAEEPVSSRRDAAVETHDLSREQR